MTGSAAPVTELSASRARARRQEKIARNPDAVTRQLVRKTTHLRTGASVKPPPSGADFGRMLLRSLLAIAFGFGSGLWLSWVALRRSREMARAQQWRSTSGRILESAIYVDRAKRQKHFRVRYEFTAVERMEGATPRASGSWFFSDRAQRAFVARWTPDQTVEVFFDPADPRKSCLDRSDRSGITVLWVMALGAIALAAVLTWYLNDDLWRLLG